VNEIKLILAHLLVHYDIKFEDDRQSPPPPRVFINDVIPDEKVSIVFRARS
jgi:hypothetical protein